MIRAESWISPPQHPLDLDLPSGPPFEPLQDAWVDRPVFEIVSGIAARWPGRLAIDDGRRRLSYDVLWTEVCALSAEILKHARAGEAVAVLLPNSASFLVAVLACLVTRRVCIPLDLNYPVARNKEILRSAGPQAILTDETARPAGLDIPAGLPVFGMPAGNETPARLEEQIGTNDDPALVLYTSGSTGQPKGIVNSSAALLQRILQHVNAGHLTENDRFLTLSSPCTIAGIRETLAPLMIGAAVHIVSAQRAGLREIRRVIQDNGITIYNSVPAMLRSLVAASDDVGTFASLRLVRLGGDVLFWSDVPTFRRALPPGCAIQVGYSSTESTGSQWFVPDHAARQGLFVPVGRLLPGLQAAVVDEEGSPTAPGDVGELLIRGRFVTLGYWDNGLVRSGPTRADPENPASRIMATGDIVRLHPNGLVDLIGRKDRQVKVNGQRAEPTELEAVLRWSPYVSDAAVLTKRDGASPRFIAFAVPGPDAPETLAADLIVAARSVLPGFMQPSRLHIVDAIPRLPSAKPDLDALVSLAARVEEEEGPPAAGPQSPDVPWQVRKTVNQAWRDLFGRNALDRDLRFDDAGGDSLKLMQLVFKMEAMLGRHVRLDLFHPQMRASEMAGAITCGMLPDPKQDDARPLILLMPGVNGDEPRLAQFRTELTTTLRFAVMDYPDWPEMVAHSMDFDALAGHVFRSVMDTVPTGALVLAGYSYGGAVAYAVAERLVQAGRKVMLLAILDTDMQSRRPEPSLILPRLALRWIRQLVRGMRNGDAPGSAGEFLAKIATHPRMTPVLPRLARVGRHSTSRVAFAFHGWMRTFLRAAALRPWLARRGPSPLTVNTVLFRSKAHPASAPPDLCWGERVAPVRIVHVGGDHHTMLDAPNRKLLCTRFRQAVGEAVNCVQVQNSRPAANPVGRTVEVREIQSPLRASL